MDNEVKAIKSALRFLVNKQLEQGSWGYEDADDEAVSWGEALLWIDKAEVKADDIQNN